MARPIVFLSDYGADGPFVGICHGVIARIAPEARVIDLQHGVPAHDVLAGALRLRAGTGYMPEDAVWLAIVDPGVGSSRRAVAIETGSGATLVGPDNGLLSLAWLELGGAARAMEITSDAVILQPTSPTFHGRDVFAPAAAHLANGMALGELGPEVPLDSLVPVELPAPEIADRRLTAVVLDVDRFGNLQLAATPEDLASAGLAREERLVVGGATARRGRTFADAPQGELALIVDSAGFLALAVNRGSAANVLRMGPGDQLVLSSIG